jgi:hypothetical protein
VDKQPYLYTVWAADFETPVRSSTYFSFFLFLGQHWQKQTIDKVCTLAFQSLPSKQYIKPYMLFG